ncbi:imidazolonepropionase [Anaerolineales bacterium HSG6]|nr:imidazolonepropionase [Anaerolineales bacterium HSG6]
MKVDVIIKNADQLVTCASPDGPKRGQAMLDVGAIRNGALAIEEGDIVAVGSTGEIMSAYTAREELDASGKVVCPGFVDPHTHVVYAGDRIAEFEMRIRGRSYVEIMESGGGILSSMRATRAAPVGQLVAETRPRLDSMLALGTTTVEIKTGYGLDTRSELTMLQAIADLSVSHPLDLIATFLGAHSVPPEYAGQTEAYVDLVVEEMLPAVKTWSDKQPPHALGAPLFCDVFCEANVFSREQSKRVLQAGQMLGFPAKIHADEFENLGGVSLAVELGAVSVDHLDVTPSHEVAQLAQSDTVGVVLPAVNFNLGSHHFADARALIDAGVALALSTDINPGSAPCPSMPLVMALACRYQHLLPAEALNASTINAAHALGVGHKVGSLEVGKQADLLIVDCNDYRHLAYQFGGNLVERVMKQSRFVRG